MQRLQGFVQNGNISVNTQGEFSTNVVMGSFPLAVITVNVTGGGLATIFSDNLGTPLSNPFTSTSTGYYEFYAANGHYDVQFSGGGLAAPLTFGDIILFDSTALGVSELVLTEGTAPAGVSGADILYADSTAHRLKMNNNTGGPLTIAATSGDTFTSTTLTSPTINSGALSGTFSGNATLSGNITATAGQNSLTVFNLDNIIFLDGVKYTTLSAAYAAASVGQTIVVPPNYTETLAASLTMNKNFVGFYFMGAATITLGANQIVVSAGVQGAFLRSVGPAGNTLPGGVVLSYTGTTTAIVVGASSAATNFLTLENISVSIFSAGSAAHGFDLIRLANSYFSNVWVVGGSGATSIGWNLDGSGGFTGDNTFINCGATAVKELFHLDGSTGNSNNNQFYGCDGFSGVASAIGFNIVNGGGNIILNADLESFGTAISYGNNSATFGNFALAYVFGNTTDVSFGAASSDNLVIITGTTTPTISDSGTSNTVWSPPKAQITAAGNLILSGLAKAINFQGVETTAPSGIASSDILYPDSTAHRWKMINNNGTGTNVAGFSDFTATLKKGSGAGNYSHSGDTLYTQVDNTNLILTVVIPVGFKLMISASGNIQSATAAVNVLAALADGGVILLESQTLPSAASTPTGFALNWVINGDGASHTVDLRFRTSNSADAVQILNSSATTTASMSFLMLPSN